MKRLFRTILDLKTNEIGQTLDFDNPEMASRLTSMGILPGTNIQRVRNAPFGDAVYIKCDGVRLALRYSEAKSVLLEL